MKRWTINSEEQLYETILRCSELELSTALESKDDYYKNQILIPKKNGFRTIFIIDKKNSLYKIQKAIFANFLSNISVASVACGFVKKSSYYDFLHPHIDFYKKNVYLRLDIHDFFGSINENLVRESMDYYCKIDDYDEKERVINSIVNVVTYKNRVVQGLVTSPSISNIIFRSLDIRIQKYCNKFNANYTRYADDLLFSSNNHNILKKSFSKGISKILNDKGFTLNFNKTLKGNGYISLNGYVISDSVKLSRSKLCEVNRIIFFLKKKANLDLVKKGELRFLNEYIKFQNNNSIDRFSNKSQFINYLNGYRAFLISMLKKTESEQTQIHYRKVIKSLEDVVKTVI